jgi:hypothetical protein
MENEVLYLIKTQYVSNNTFETVSEQLGKTKKHADALCGTFEVVSQRLDGTRKQASALNKAYDDQKRSLGDLKTKVNEWRKASESSYRSDHVKKYNSLIVAAKGKIEELGGSARSTKNKVDELAGAAAKCKEKTQSIFAGVFSANLLMKGLGAAKSAISNFTRESVDAYMRHNVALTQLEQVMRNTMGAGKWDVNDVVEFTGKEAKKGVVSRDVQLSGAKELGTYLKHRDSLKSLIPVMNDVLAHQYGLNTTQEQASGIAQMFGKVLDGQTAALSRNGYTFNEAQEQVLKYGTESERVAVLAEVVSQSVGGVNEALAATPEGMAKQTAIEYEELSLRVGELLTKLKGDASTTLKRYAVALYDNRETIAKIAKITGVAAVGIGSYVAVVKAGITATKIKTTVLAAKAAITGVYTGGIKIATIATAAFNTIMKMNPIGAAIGVVLAAVAAFSAFRKKTDEATEATKRSAEAMKKAHDVANSYYASERSNLDKIFEQLNRTNPKSKERNELVDELKRMYPDLNKQIEDELRNTNNLANAYSVLIGNIQKKARIKAKESVLEDLYKEMGNFDNIISEIVEEELRRNPTKTVMALGGKLGDPASQEVERTWAEVTEEVKNKVLNSKDGWYRYSDGGGGQAVELQIFERAKKAEAKANQILKQVADMSFDGSGTGGGGGGGSGDNNNNNANESSRTSDTITGGGSRPANIYINLNRDMVGSLTIQPATLTEGVEKMREIVSQELVKILNSANAIT